MQRGFLFLLGMLMICCRVGAVPTRASLSHMQGDGTILSLLLMGDEWCHHFLTSDYVVVLPDGQGDYKYAVVDGGELVPGGKIAHDVGLRTPDEQKYVEIHRLAVDSLVASVWARQSQKANVQRHMRMKIVDSRFRLPSAGNLYLGNKRGLVILVNFTDVAMQGDNSRLRFERMFNEHGYSDYGHIGSVSDYFREQSYGQFHLEFDVIGPITLPNKCAYYGANDKSGSDKRPAEMVATACKLADNQVDFENYDWDADGDVESVFVIYAGYAESDGASPSTIWPHQYELSSAAEYGDGEGALTLDGVTVDSYACSSELAGNSGTQMVSIGTACHEFSHCLGLADMYDTGYSGGFGMEHWDIMSSGSNNGPAGRGEIPYGYTAFERAMCGWLEPIVLTHPESIADMPCLGETPVAYVIPNDANPDGEMLWLENHQATRWFSYVGRFTGMHGLMVSHLDYDEKAWSRNQVNRFPEHQRFNIIPANRKFGTQYFSGGRAYYTVTEEEYAGHLFPGKGNVRELTSTSHSGVGGKTFSPNSNGDYAFNMPIDLIKEHEGLLSFDVGKYFVVPRPIELEVSDITQDGFTLTWEEGLPADSFLVRLETIPENIPGTPISNLIPKQYNFTTQDAVYSFSNLTASCYKIRVKAFVGERQSEWSEEVDVMLPADAVMAVKDERHSSEFYSLSGVRLARMHKSVIYIKGGHKCFYKP